MEEFQVKWLVLIKLNKFKNLSMFLIQGLLLIFYGMILMKMLETGKRMKEDVDKFSEGNSYKNFWLNMI